MDRVNVDQPGNSPRPLRSPSEELSSLREETEHHLASLDKLLLSAGSETTLTLTPEVLQSIVQITKANLAMTRATEKACRQLEGQGLKTKIEGEPLNLVLVRHGRSVGNERDAILALDDSDPRKVEYLKTANFRYRLMTQGRKEAQAAGSWIKNDLDLEFHAAFCPDFIRSQETAGIIDQEIGLTVKWRESGIFGERHWGKDFDGLGEAAKEEFYQERVDDPRHATPPGGIPMEVVELGARLAVGTMHRKYNMQNVLVSTHGERINAFRSVIERLPVDRLQAIMDKGPPNCGIVQYTRENPDTGEVIDHWGWVRLVCPYDFEEVRAGEKWDGKWRKIERPEYSGTDLLERVSKVPQIYDADFNLPV